MITLTVSYPQFPSLSSCYQARQKAKTASASSSCNMYTRHQEQQEHHRQSHHSKLQQQHPQQLMPRKEPTGSKHHQHHTHNADTTVASVMVEQLFEDFHRPAHEEHHSKGKASELAAPSAASQAQRISSKSSMQNSTSTADTPSVQKPLNSARLSVSTTSRKKSSSRPTSSSSVIEGEEGQRLRRSTQNACIRMSGEDALRQCPGKLTDWEKAEIVQFRNVYYLGSMTAKKAAQMEGEKNNCFDDREGFMVCKAKDHLLYRYEIQEILGTGTFGQVVKAIDHKTKTTVAVKIVKNERPFLRQAREEIRILETLRKIDTVDSLNIVHILDSFTFRGHVCITFELLGVSLHQLLKRTRNQGFSLARVKRLTRGILRCLDGLFKNRIIHCDLKPENILLRRNASGYSMGTGNNGGLSEFSIKIIDFGSSCYEQQQIYSYIQSRYYRAPEVILGARYTCAIDMWSMACVMGELLLGGPLFAGSDEFDQLSKIMEVRGVPPRTLLDRCKQTDKYFNAQGQPRYMTNGGSTRRGAPMSVHLSTALRNCEDSSFLDFMRRALTWDPSTRLTPPEALSHPWITRGSTTTPKGEADGGTPAPAGASRAGSLKLPDAGTKSETVTTAKVVGKQSSTSAKALATNNNSTMLSRRSARPRATASASHKRATCTVSVETCFTSR